MERVVLIYLIANAWFAGNTVDVTLKKEYKKKWIRFLSLIISQSFMFSFGLITFILFLIFNTFKRVFIWIETTFQLKFWWRWHTGKYDKMPEIRMMEHIKMRVRNYNGKTYLTLGEKHFLRCANILFERYNYK